ncbi:MAG: phospholipase D-like domain-containing protein [Thermoproteota archaeon]
MQDLNIETTLSRRVTINPRCKTYVAFEFPSKKPYLRLLTLHRMSEELRDVCARASSEVLIVSPYVTKEALIHILGEIGDDVSVAVIVGTRSSYLEVKKAEEFLNREISVRLRGRVHCKIVLTDNEVVIGSSNMTVSGLERSHEASIVTNDPNVLSNARSFCKLLWEGVEYKEQYYRYPDIVGMPMDNIFVTSLKNLPSLVLELAKHAEKSIIIATPTYTVDAIELLLNATKPSTHVEAFVKVDEKDWGERGAISDPWAIRLLLHKGATVWDVPLLHAKIFIIDYKIALVSSMNFTNQSFKYIFDAGIITKNKNLVDSLVEFISRLRRRQVEREAFEGILASFNAKLPFILASAAQKEGDHFSDEEDPSYSEAEVKDVEAPSYTYPEHAGSELNLPLPPKPLRRIRSKVPRIRPADTPPEGVVLIGRKPLIEYFKACTFLFLNERKSSVTIKARGRLISKAVDLAQMFRHTVIKNKGIKVGSSKLIGFDGKIRDVSFIEIILYRLS